MGGWEGGGGGGGGVVGSDLTIKRGSLEAEKVIFTSGERIKTYFILLPHYLF